MKKDKKIKVKKEKKAKKTNIITVFVKTLGEAKKKGNPFAELFG